MSQNTYCNPRLYIEDVGIIENLKGTVTFPSNNQISTLKVTISGTDIPESAILNKKVRFYLNYGADDTVPYFIGYIKQIKPTDKNFSLVAYDPRCFLGGEYAETFHIDEANNYDGFTLSQFLTKYINDRINKDKILIDVNNMNDTSPPVTLSGYRKNDTTPYSACLELIQFAMDDSDIFNMFAYDIGIKFGVENASLTFIKEKPLSDIPSMTLSYGDGIISYSYDKLKIPNRTKFEDVRVDFGGSDNIRVSKDVSKFLSAKRFRNRAANRALVSKELTKALIMARRDKYNITLSTTKGHYLSLGSLVNLNINEEIKGTHRLTEKVLNFSEKGTSLKLKLNTKANTINSSY
tara:strand:+ start:16463 stop:17512 length:1050 start_codon:yes stop_codon:yes gene_type:complete